MYDMHYDNEEEATQEEADEFQSNFFDGSAKMSKAVQVAMNFFMNYPDAHALNTRRNGALLAYWLSPYIIEDNVAGMKMALEDQAALMFLSGKSKTSLHDWFIKARYRHKEKHEAVKKEAQAKGQNIKHYQACKLGLDASSWEDSIVKVDVDRSAIEKREGAPCLYPYKEAYFTTRPLEKRKQSSMSLEARKKISKSNRDNYNGVGESDCPLTGYHEEYWNILGNMASFLYECCERANNADNPPGEWKFEAKFLHKTNAGVWNGVWIKNIYEFAKAYGMGGEPGLTRCLSWFRHAGFKFASTSMAAKSSSGMKWTDPNLEVWIFHPDFYKGVPKEVLRKINKGYTQRIHSLKKDAEQKKNLIDHLKKYTLVEVAPSNIDGVGLRALVDIGKGQSLFRSCNPDADASETIDLSEDEIEDNLPHQVQILIKKFILKSPGGLYPVPVQGLVEKLGASMYMNSSIGTKSKPNVKQILKSNDTTGYAMMETMRNISKGEELLFRYEYMTFSDEEDADNDENDDDHESLIDDSKDMPPPQKSRTTAKKTATKSATKSGKKADLSDDDFSDEEIPKPTKKRAPAKSATSRKKKRQDDSDSDDDVSKAPACATASRARSMAKKPKYNYDDDYVDKAPGRATSSRARSTAKKPKYNYDDDDDDIINEEETQAAKTKGRNGATKSKAKTASGRVNRCGSDDDDDQPPAGGREVQESNYKPGCYEHKQALFLMPPGETCWKKGEVVKGRVLNYVTKEQRNKNDKESKTHNRGMYRYILDGEDGEDGDDMDFFSDEDEGVEIDGKQGAALWRSSH